MTIYFHHLTYECPACHGDDLNCSECLGTGMVVKMPERELRLLRWADVITWLAALACLAMVGYGAWILAEWLSGSGL